MHVWLTSDNHFGHLNVIKYCNRPFVSLEEMNETMVERWNKIVRAGDLVYHLGDFALGPSGTAATWRRRLNGRIELVLGNHDRSATHMLEAGIEAVYPRGISMPLADRHVHLSHRPPRPGQAWTDLFLHGHVHEKYARRGSAINVGVDVRDFRPVSLEELLATPDELG